MQGGIPGCNIGFLCGNHVQRRKEWRLVIISETILNIYLIIENGYVSAFKAKAYESDEGDQEKIHFLKKRASDDYAGAYVFDAPANIRGEYMKYSQFARLEERGMHFKLFEEIFSKFNVPENPLVCVTPVVDGVIFAEIVD